jgi:hypothetical protein
VARSVSPWPGGLRHQLKVRNAMNTQNGFHATYPTAIDSEINLADNLYITVMMRWGRWRLPRVMRTNPAATLSKLAYLREPDCCGIPCACVQGVPANPHTRANNEQILTPSHMAWDEFQERLHAELQCPDFEWRYGGARVVMQEEISTEYWPLCSANIIADMGFAVAESLCVFRSFLGDTDERIYEHTASLWRSTKPRPGHEAFDAERVF